MGDFRMGPLVDVLGEAKGKPKGVKGTRRKRATAKTRFFLLVGSREPTDQAGQTRELLESCGAH